MTGTVAIAGNMILDNIKFIDSYPSLLELAAIRGLRRELGGAVCNVGRSLARLDASIPIRPWAGLGKTRRAITYWRSCAGFPPSMYPTSSAAA